MFDSHVKPTTGGHYHDFAPNLTKRQLWPESFVLKIKPYVAYLSLLTSLWIENVFFSQVSKGKGDTDSVERWWYNMLLCDTGFPHLYVIFEKHEWNLMLCKERQWVYVPMTRRPSAMWFCHPPDSFICQHLERAPTNWYKWDLFFRLVSFPQPTSTFYSFISLSYVEWFFQTQNQLS